MQHVVLSIYVASKEPGKGQRESFHALVTKVHEQNDPEKHPFVDVIYFDHSDSGSHHALGGVDWADTLERVLMVPHASDVAGAPVTYRDVFGESQERSRLQSLRIKELEKQLAQTTEGKDAALQTAADKNAKPKSAKG